MIQVEEFKTRLRARMLEELDAQIDEDSTIGEEIAQAQTIGALICVLGDLEYDAASAMSILVSVIVSEPELEGEELENIPDHWST